MKSFLKKQNFTLFTLLWITTAGYSQKEFFRSQQVFTEEHMSNFYSSVTIHDAVVIFNANDYQVYAYNKNDGILKWSVETWFKSTAPLFVQDSIVYAGIYKDKIESTAQFSLAEGKFIKKLPFGPLATTPLIKNGMLYGTAIYNYGCIIAYDLKKDTVAWSRFIAHGYSRQPYYFKNKIFANAEGNSWIALGYDGVAVDTNCAVKTTIFEDIPCVEDFIALSHDGQQIKGRRAEIILDTDEFGRPPVLTAQNYTYIYKNDKLSILSNKLKIKQQVQISSLADSLHENSKTKLLKADNENVWIFYGDHLLQYNHKIKKLVRLSNLAAWQPHQVLLDGENVWLISGKDGLLYGLTL